MENNEDLELLELQELALKCTTESVVRFNHLKKRRPVYSNRTLLM